METFSSSPDKLVKEDNKSLSFFRNRRNLIILLSLILIVIIIIIIILVSISNNEIKININYTENEGVLGNPLKGFVMFVNETSKRPFPLSLEYLRLDLNKIMPEENKVDLDYLERELSSAKKRNVQLIIRIVCIIQEKMLFLNGQRKNLI